MLITVAITTVAFACTALGTGMLRTRAHNWGLLDVPNERSMHTRAMPRGGGIVLVLAVLTGLMLSAVGNVVPPGPAAAYAAITLLVAAIGWRDDLSSVAPLLRLLTHIVAAAAAMTLWGTFDRVHLPYSTDLALPGAVGVGLTAFWLVGMLNAYNFMDGIDGIAAGQAVVAGIVWVLLGAATAPLVMVTGALIAAASFGFLFHNWPPARIFLGDAGSGFLGFSFALLPLLAHEATGDARLPTAGLLVMAPFVYDTLFTLARRSMRGENILRAHRSHLYQRLVTGGLTHGVTTRIYVGLALASGGAAVAWVRGASDAVVLVPLAAILCLPLLTSIVERKRLS